MIEVAINNSNNVINLEDVCENESIFVKNKEGKLCGMISKDEKGWIIKIGSHSGATGYWHNRIDCLQSGLRFGYKYFVEE